MQNAVALQVPGPAPAAANTATDDATAGADASALPPRHFGALLALQMGGNAQPGKKAAASPDSGGDEKKSAGDTTPATPLDALAALNLPNLTPVAVPIAAPPQVHAHGGHAVHTAADGAAVVTATVHEAAGDVHAAAMSRSAEIVAPAAEHAPPTAHAASDVEALQAPAVHTGEHSGRGADMPAVPQAMLAPITAAATAVAAAPAQAAIQARVGTPEWDTELGQKIVWMVGDKHQVAEMHINPPELGPLDIKLSIDGQQTTAVFTSPHSAVRDAVESALPRLREVLADSGIMLGNASVTSDTPRDSQAFTEQRPRGRDSGRLPVADGGQTVTLSRVTTGTRGLVDFFA